VGALIGRGTALALQHKLEAAVNDFSEVQCCTATATPHSTALDSQLSKILYCSPHEYCTAHSTALDSSLNSPVLHSSLVCTAHLC